MGAFSAKCDLKPMNGSESSIGLLSVTGDCSIQYATEMKEALLDCLDKHDTIHLDFVKTESFDLASIQLLYSAQKYAFRLGKTMQLVGEPPSLFIKIANEAGFDHLDWLCFEK